MNDEGNAPQSTAQSPEALLSDPARIARIASMIGALQASPQATKETAETVAPISQAAENSPQNPPFAGDGLLTLLSNPAMLEILPQLMTMMKPMLASMAQSAPTAALQPSATHSHTSDRDNLLLAIKPFLSENRREAVDTLLRIEKLGEVFSHLKSP